MPDTNISRLLGGYVYQQHMAVLRMIDLLDYRHPVSGVQLEHPILLENKDFFDDIGITLTDGSVHRFQVKWGFQQSYDNDLTVWSLPDFKNASGKLYILGLFESWQGYQDSGVNPFCHIYTSKPADDSLVPFLNSCEDDIPFEGTYFHFNTSLFDQLGAANRAGIDRARFERFLGHLYLSFDQPQLVIENELSGHQGAMKDHILNRINELGLPDSSYLKNQQLDENTLYDKLCNIASNANLSSQFIDLKSLKKRLDLDPTRGSIEQPTGVDENILVERRSDLSELNRAITNCDGGLICLIGRPGSGKSWLLEHWHSTQVAIPMFYCFRGLNDELLLRRSLEDQAVKNLLFDFDRFFENVFGSRPYANTLEELQERLNILSGELQNGNKQIIIIDGLDHAVRTSAQLATSDATVVQLLEKLVVPKGVVILVGTQPGEHLDGLSSRTTVVNISGFLPAETTDYLRNKLDIELSDDQCNRLHVISDGLPLMLRCFATQITMPNNSTSDVVALINEFPDTGGAINQYYDYLWNSLPGYHRSGTEGAAHKLLKTLAVRKPGFVLTEQRLRDVLPRALVGESDYTTTLKQVTPVIDIELLARGEFALFANSLQIYVIRKMEQNSDYHEFHQHAYDYCSSRFNTFTGHRFRLQYACDLGLREDILSIVTQSYIDNATVSLFPREDIRRNIEIAIAAAYDDNKIVDVARLGLLNFYTRHRFENIEERYLLKNLVYRGDSQQVQDRILYENDFIFSESDTLELLLDSIALNVPLDYAQLFSTLMNKIVELDEETKKSIDPVDFWGLAIASGNGLDYYHDNFLNIIEGKSPEVKDDYYRGFIEALAGYASADTIREYSELDGFGEYSRELSLASISALQREGLTEAAKHMWTDHVGEYGIDSTKILYQGCRLKVAEESISSRVDYNLSIIEPPDQHIISDDFLSQADDMLSTVCALAYVGNSERVAMCVNAISAFPRSYMKEILQIAIHVRITEGHYLSGQSTTIEPAVIKRLVDYEEKLGEQPRVFDVTLSSGVSKLVCGILEVISTIVNETGVSVFCQSLNHVFANRLGYSVSGYSYEFPSTKDLLDTVQTIVQNVSNSGSVTDAISIAKTAEAHVLSAEGYERERTTALLDISNLWALVGDSTKAEELFRQALLDSHSYGQHKDITFLQGIRSLGHENERDDSGVILRTKAFMDMALKLGWLTDWKEVRTALPELCDELASRKLEKAFVLTNIFLNGKYRNYYDSCLKSCVEHSKSDYGLLFALSETIIEVRNMYDELVHLFGLRTGIIHRAYNSGAFDTSLELAKRLRLFLLRDVAQSERGVLVSTFNKVADKVGIDRIIDIEEHLSGSDRNRQTSVLVDGQEIQFLEFIERVNGADFGQLQEVCNRLDRNIESYNAFREIERRAIELSRQANHEQLSVLKTILLDQEHEKETSEALWALAIAEKRLENHSEYLIHAKKACESERGWGGVFTPSNETRLAGLAQDDYPWVESFFLERMYECALTGLYIDTAFSIPTLQAVDLATGNVERSHQLWVVFHEIIVSLFRHVPGRESPFSNLLDSQDISVTESLSLALFARLESDDYAVKHRTAEILAELVSSHSQIVDQIVERLSTTTHHTTKILLVALLEFALATDSYDLRSHRETLEQVFRNEQSFYVRKQLEQILKTFGTLSARIIHEIGDTIELLGPSNDFKEQVLDKCIISTRRLLAVCSRTLEISLNELTARIELDVQIVQPEFSNMGAELREQLREFRSPDGKIIPFESSPDYHVHLALNRVIFRLISSGARVNESHVFDLLREHDPQMWLTHKSSKPSHVTPIPKNDNVDEWFEVGNEIRETIHVSDIEAEVVLAEMETIDSERIKYTRQVGAVFVAREQTVDSINADSLDSYLINPGGQYRTIDALRREFIHSTLLIEGTPLFCYQFGFWFLQGSYEYLRINPRIEADLQLTWTSRGSFDMEFQGSPALRFLAWRNGFTPDEYSRSEEQSGCFATLDPNVIRTIIEQYDMNILIITNESRTRKEEQWREGREEETKSSYGLKLLKID